MRRRSGKLKRRSCLCLNWFGPRCPSAPAWRLTVPPSRWTTSGARPCRPSQSPSSKSCGSRPLSGSSPSCCQPLMRSPIPLWSELRLPSVEAGNLGPEGNREALAGVDLGNCYLLP